MSYLDEYKEAGSQHRMQSNLMFGQLAVFLITTGGIAKLISGLMEHKPLVIVMAIVGVIISISFYIITSRAASFSHIAVRRAQELEIELGYKLFSNHCKLSTTFLTAINAVKVIYISAGLAWASIVYHCF